MDNPELDRRPVHVVLDSTRCEGHGNCYIVAPGIFGSDDEGRAVLRFRDVDEPEQIEAAQAASKICPERAISVHRV